jgi:hypothetical protein
MMFRNDHPRHSWEQKNISKAIQPFDPAAKADNTPGLPPPLWPETEMPERARPRAAFTLEQRLCQLFAD